MIKLNIFPFEQLENANKFMEKNPPRSTPTQSGVIFHNGNIVIIYDDGKENSNEHKELLTHELEGKRKEKWLSEAKKSTAQKVLDELVPEGYSFQMDDRDIEKLLMKQGLTDAKTLKNVVEKIAHNENEILMANHEIQRLGYEIQGFESELEKLTK